MSNTGCFSLSSISANIASITIARRVRNIPNPVFRIVNPYMKSTIPIPYVIDPFTSRGTFSNDVHSSLIFVESKNRMTNRKGTPNRTTDLHPRLWSSIPPITGDKDNPM